LCLHYCDVYVDFLKKGRGFFPKSLVGKDLGRKKGQNTS